MNIFLLILSVVSFMFANLSQSHFANSSGNRKKIPAFFGATWFLISGILFFIVALCMGALQTSSFTLWCGICAGFAFAFASYAALIAMKTGPLSLTVLIASFAMVVPVTLSSIVYNEGFSVAQIAGLVLMALVFIIINTRVKEQRPATLKWFVICVFCALSNGVVMFCAKTHQVLLPGQEQPVYLCIAFLAAAFFSMIIFLCAKKDADPYPFTTKTFYLPALFTGVFIGLANFLSLILTPLFPAVVLFPSYQGGTFLLTTLVSMLFLREEKTPRKIICVGLGLIAILMLNL